jgi:hypothetical protein
MRKRKLDVFTEAYRIAQKLAALPKETDIEVFGPVILDLMKGVPYSVWIELDERPGSFSYMQDRFYMLRRVRNDPEWGRKLFDGFTKD